MMSNLKKSDAAEIHAMRFCRRKALKIFGAGLLMPLTACGQGEKKMRTHTVLNVEMFSYVDRVIIDIVFNGVSLGVMSGFGGTGVIMNVQIPFGPQKLSWTLSGPRGTPRNGERVEVKNLLTIAPEQIPVGARYLGLHLYPDDTAEITFADGMNDRTERGMQIWRSRK